MTFSRSTTPSSYSAFTLVELLVAITIVAVLSALLMAALSSGRAAANAATAQNNLRQIFAATSQFTQENQNHYPRCAYSNDEGENRLYFFKMQENYVADFTDSALQPYLGGTKEAVEKAFTVPGDSMTKGEGGTKGRNFSFSINFLVNLRAPDPQTERVGLATIKTTDVLFPESRAFIYEQESPDDGYCVWFIEQPTKRHSGQSHVLFFDGHVERRPFERVFSDFGIGEVVPPDYQTF